MRIIGGKYKGRQFSPGKKFKARPTTDFARENLFNILHHTIDIEDLKVLDLFGGTGSISYEFFSRGCENILCVEKNFAHYAFIKKCVAELKAEKEITPLKADVQRFIAAPNGNFDLVFADPPYDLPWLEKIPNEIFKNGFVRQDGMLILEHGRTNDFSDHPNFVQLKRYGSVHFSFFEHKELEETEAE